MYSSSYKINPIPRHGMTVCINAANGDIVFTLNGGIRNSATANGYIIGIGDYDGNYWAIGKGPTSTTVTAQQQLDGSALIQGSVIDTSPIAQEYASKVKFANGVPAVSDADMSEWMDYLYMQNATLLNNPPFPNGVSVTLTAIGSDGSVIDIGKTKTNGFYGTFAQAWTPPKEDTYQIIATFEGSESYYSSGAATAVTVGQATESPTQPVVEVPDYTMTIIGVGIAIIVVVVIAVAVAVLLLRKR